jgi:hypothetical protein
MKIIFFFFLLWVPSVYAQELQPKVEISDLRVKGGIVSGAMRATGGQEVRVWSDANQWGAARWRIIQVGRDGGVNVYYQNPYIYFTRNVPNYHVIGPGKTRNFSLNVNGGGWCDGVSCVQEGVAWKSGRKKFSRGDKLIIFYDAPASPEATRFRVWYGLASASLVISN